MSRLPEIPIHTTDDPPKHWTPKAREAGEQIIHIMAAGAKQRAVLQVDRKGELAELHSVIDEETGAVT